MAPESVGRVAARHEMPTAYFNGVKGYLRCPHEHKQFGTAVFFHSLGILRCNRCAGYQAIKKPLD